MGYIDADTHLIETDETWSYYDPHEAGFRPQITNGHWTIGDLFMEWPGPGLQQYKDAYPGGAVDLSDVSSRLKYMDQLGVDVHMLFPTFWIGNVVGNAVAEAAMSRSYNRWLAETTADSNGRLKWAAHVPVRTIERAIEEIRFSREHGAVSVYLHGANHGISLSDPSMLPLYEVAQDLDMAITVHIGGDVRVFSLQPGLFLHEMILKVPGSLHSVVVGGLTKRFPRLRWSFIEAGATWLPFVFQEIFRADETGSLRDWGSTTSWRDSARELMETSEIYVACQADDDLPYLLELTGPDRLVHGTDFGHLDLGSDPAGLHSVATRPDIDQDAARRIVDDNARKLYGIDQTFRPAPAASSEGLVFDASVAAGAKTELAARTSVTVRGPG